MNARSGDFGISAMCRAMKLNRSTVYYKPNEKKRLERIEQHEKDLKDVKEAFEEGKGNY